MFNKISSWWGSSAGSEQEPPKPNSLNPNGLKPCCACPETKSARDACFLNADPSKVDEMCRELVMAHVKCMQSYGFEIQPSPPTN